MLAGTVSHFCFRRCSVQNSALRFRNSPQRMTGDAEKIRIRYKLVQDEVKVPGNEPVTSAHENGTNGQSIGKLLNNLGPRANPIDIDAKEPSAATRRSNRLVTRGARGKEEEATLRKHQTVLDLKQNASGIPVSQLATTNTHDDVARRRSNPSGKFQYFTSESITKATNSPMEHCRSPTLVSCLTAWSMSRTVQRTCTVTCRISNTYRRHELSGPLVDFAIRSCTGCPWRVRAQKILPKRVRMSKWRPRWKRPRQTPKVSGKVSHDNLSAR